MAETSNNEQRIAIPYFEGVNSTVQHVISKITELSHSENARSKQIGSIEKREGQARYGTNTHGVAFYGVADYGLFKFANNGQNIGVFRVSAATTQDPSTLSLSVFDLTSVGDYPLVGSNIVTLVVKPVEYVSVAEPTIFSRLDTDTIILDGTSTASNIYSLSPTLEWTGLSDTSAQNIIGANIDTARFDTNIALVNGHDYNRYIKGDGVTVVDSAEAGHLFNSPRAKKVSYYKNRIYLANFTRNGVEYPTTIMRSSYPLGIVALANGDSTGHTSGADLEVTDTKYFYTDSGMNSYEVYRGFTKVANITVTAVNATSVTVTHSGTVDFLSADEIWVAGTFTGEKQYRWVSGPSSISRDVKQYDSFKLSGGDEDGITMMVPLGNVLMIANKNSLMTWNDYMLENLDLGIGCASPNGYVKHMGACYFLHYTGVYSTTGGVPVLISRKIERYIRGATKAGIENAATGFKGLSVFFSIGDVTLYKKDNSFWKTLSDVCLEYHIADQNWYVHTNVPAGKFANFIDTAGTEHLLMNHTGSNTVKEFLVGNTDDGEEIHFRADTQLFQLMKKPEMFASPTAIVAEIDRGSLVECFVSVDGADFYPVKGAFRKGISFLKISEEKKGDVSPQTCRNIQISFRDSSKQICKLLQLSMAFSPSNVVAATED